MQEGFNGDGILMTWLKEIELMGRGMTCTPFNKHKIYDSQWLAIISETISEILCIY